MIGKTQQTIAENQFNPMGVQFLMNDLRHFEIQWSQDLRQFFNQGDFDATFSQVLSHFNPNEPTPNDNSSLWLFGFNEAIDRIRIRDVS